MDLLRSVLCLQSTEIAKDSSSSPSSSLKIESEKDSLFFWAVFGFLTKSELIACKLVNKTFHKDVEHYAELNVRLLSRSYFREVGADIERCISVPEMERNCYLKLMFHLQEQKLLLLDTEGTMSTFSIDAFHQLKNPWKTSPTTTEQAEQIKQSSSSSSSQVANPQQRTFFNAIIHDGNIFIIGGENKDTLNQMSSIQVISGVSDYNHKLVGHYIHIGRHNICGLNYHATRYSVCTDDANGIMYITGGLIEQEQEGGDASRDNGSSVYMMETQTLHRLASEKRAHVQHQLQTQSQFQGEEEGILVDDRGQLVNEQSRYNVAIYGDLEGEASVDMAEGEPIACSWEHLNGEMNQGRYGHGSVIHNGQLWVAGGYMSSRASNSVECYDFETQQWTEMPSMSEKRFHCSLMSKGDELYCCAGDVSDLHYYTSIEHYNAAENKWDIIATLNNHNSFGASCMAYMEEHSKDVVIVIFGTNPNQETIRRIQATAEAQSTATGDGGLNNLLGILQAISPTTTEDAAVDYLGRGYVAYNVNKQLWMEDQGLLPKGMSSNFGAVIDMSGASTNLKKI
jgi:hypothetical protein